MLNFTSTQQSKQWQIPAVTPRGRTTPVSKALPLATQRIAEGLHPEQIILFGSYAYGTPTPDSDVDLLVVMDTTASTSERYLAVCRLLRPRPFPVDILVKTPPEIKLALEAGDFFIEEIVSQGRVLYEQNH
jgi:predicted nucleotidyltransferase